MASAAPRAWSDSWKAVVTASPFWVRSEPQKLAISAAVDKAARRAASVLVNGTGGTIGHRRGGDGGGAPATRACTRRAKSRSAVRAAMRAWKLTNQPKKGTSTGVVATRCTRVWAPSSCGVSSTVSVLSSNGTAGNGASEMLSTVVPSSTAVSPASSRASASSVTVGGASTSTGRTHRTCGMLRRPPSRGDPNAHARTRRPRPAFTLIDQHGEKVKLSDFKGHPVVVYFYPRADTPGCTTQSCALRDAEPDLSKLDAVVLGISPDTPEKQAKFDEKYGLGFTLLADTEHVVAEKFGVWGEKMNYGRKYMGIVRSAFVVGPNGKIVDAFYKVSPKDTVPKVTKAIESLTV